MPPNPECQSLFEVLHPSHWYKTEEPSSCTSMSEPNGTRRAPPIPFGMIIFETSNQGISTLKNNIDTIQDRDRADMNRPTPKVRSEDSKPFWNDPILSLSTEKRSGNEQRDRIFCAFLLCLFWNPETGWILVSSFALVLRNLSVVPTGATLPRGRCALRRLLCETVAMTLT